MCASEIFADISHGIYILNSVDSIGMSSVSSLLQEMIIDEVDNKNVPRYLIYDIVKFEVCLLFQLLCSCKQLTNSIDTVAKSLNNTSFILCCYQYRYNISVKILTSVAESLCQKKV